MARRTDFVFFYKKKILKKKKNYPYPSRAVNAFGVERVTFPGDVCWTYHHVLHIIAGVTNIIAVTILVPIKCYRLIRQHRPLQDGEHYTASGELVSNYTDKENRLALAEDGSPYKFLFRGGSNMSQL